MRCPLCRDDKQDGEFSDEHIIPYALGGGLSIRLCKVPCNDLLGRLVDAALVNHPLIEIVRQGLQIPGRSGVPNAFKEGYLAEDPSVRVRWHPEVDPTGRLTGQVSAVPGQTKAPDGTTTMVLGKAQDPAEVAERMRARLNVSEVRLVPNEPRTFRTPAVQTQSRGNAGVVRPSIAKICFELGLYWLGDRYQDDPGAAALRDPLRHIVATGDVQGWPGLPGVVLFPAVRTETAVPELFGCGSTSHVARLTRVGDRLGCVIRLFNILEAQVELTRQADQYPHARGEEALVFRSTDRTVAQCAWSDVPGILGPDGDTRVEVEEIGTTVHVRTYFNGSLGYKATLGLAPQAGT